MSFQIIHHQLTIQVKTKTQQTACPIYHAQTGKIHSRYPRTVADLSWGDYQVRLELLAEKFFCHNKKSIEFFGTSSITPYLCGT